MMIKRVDGKRMPSRDGKGFPYSVSVSPGTHTLTIYLSDLSGGNVYVSQYADMELSVAVVSGHQYVLKYKTDGRLLRPYIVDLGANVSCKYVIAGSMLRGYIPVELSCN